MRFRISAFLMFFVVSLSFAFDIDSLIGSRQKGLKKTTVLTY
jgi:hypothetical protein